MISGIDDMPNLRERLSQKVHRLERVRYRHDPTPTKRGKNIVNTVLDYMQLRKPSDTHCPVSDIIAGVCRLDNHGQRTRNIPLSQNRVYSILTTMEVINTREVMSLTGLGERQAQVYVKACELAVRFIEKLMPELDEWGVDEDIQDSLDNYWGGHE